MSLDGTYPSQGISVGLSENMKLWSDAPNYPDPNYPWRPYIPGVTNDSPEEFRWITSRLFRYEAYRMVTKFAPFGLMEPASLNIPRSLKRISTIRQEIRLIFPWLSRSTFTLPPPPAPDVLQAQAHAGAVEVAIRQTGLAALDILGLTVFCSYNHPDPLGLSSLDDVLPWSRHRLRGVVLDLETMTFEDLATFVRHGVPVYYICRRDGPDLFPPALINAKDRDGEVEKSHRDEMSARKASKARDRRDHQTARQSNPSVSAPVQRGKKCHYLKYDHRFKKVSKNTFSRLYNNGTSSTHDLPTGIVDILELKDEPTDDEGFSDTDPILVRSSVLLPPPSTSRQPAASFAGPSNPGDLHSVRYSPYDSRSRYSHRRSRSPRPFHYSGPSRPCFSGPQDQNALAHTSRGRPLHRDVCQFVFFYPLRPNHIIRKCSDVACIRLITVTVGRAPRS